MTSPQDETCESVKRRLQKRLDISDEDFEGYRVNLVDTNRTASKSIPNGKLLYPLLRDAGKTK